MDINTIVIMIIIAVGIWAAFEWGYRMGKRHGVLEYKLGIAPTIPAPFNLFPQKDEPYHERDPWDEQRIDIPDRPQVIQTLAEEDHG
jgi:hypothetical protein